MVQEWKVKHGLYGTRIYEIWRGMKKRCYLKSHTHYSNYGGRGIKVCDEWKQSVKSFNDWAVTHGYRDDLTIDRIDNDGDYCPDNCRWVTYKEQMRNTKRNHFLTVKGVTKTIKDWAETVGINEQTLCERAKRGWTDEQIVLTKLKGVR